MHCSLFELPFRKDFLNTTLECVGTLLNIECVVGKFNWDFRGSYVQKVFKETAFVVRVPFLWLWLTKSWVSEATVVFLTVAIYLYPVLSTWKQGRKVKDLEEKMPYG